jgi:hypothetical protein
LTDRMGWLCEDCYAWVATSEAAGAHCDEWRHSLAMCPESRRGLRMWTVYDHPLDFPEHWVVRPGRVLRDGYHPAPRAWPFDTLEEARAFIDSLNEGLVRIQGRDRSDPKIREVWC